MSEKEIFEKRRKMRLLRHARKNRRYWKNFYDKMEEEKE
tara:strand:+ start:676 stop:792 length:117 start_codon:yes stop_codon:yes gene_type:complete